MKVLLKYLSFSVINTIIISFSIIMSPGFAKADELCNQCEKLNAKGKCVPDNLKPCDDRDPCTIDDICFGKNCRGKRDPSPTDPSCIPGDGCTPGYWKQNQHFDSWTELYTPDTLFSDVFDDAFPGLTLLDVLNLEGGDLDALGRHVVAAFLNAASQDVSYNLTVDEVIDLFNEAFSDGDTTDLKNLFEYFNEQGCPLN
jgi:hypothetical protein